MHKLPNSATCFVCGDRNAAGLGVRFLTDGDRVTVTLVPREPHMGYRGIVHGGVLTALLDETMGWAPTVRTGRFCMAVELHIEFRRSVPVGVEITVTGWTTDTTKRIWTAEGEIRGADGTLYARGRGRYMPMPKDNAREVADYLQYDDGCLGRERFVDDGVQAQTPPARVPDAAQDGADGRATEPL
ncbi:MAG TPA: PaaI family thioesterase [Chthonomonadales bacterium]|nr:PaaI family thioesterase [Chthonomonadales bacterium]